MTETLTFRKTLSSENLKLVPDRFSSSTTHQQRSLFGFIGSFFKSISTNINVTLISIRRRRSCATCLPFLPTYFEIKPVYPLLEEIFKHTLFNLHSVHKILATSNTPYHHRNEFQLIADEIYAIISNHNDFSEILPIIQQTPDNVFLQKLRHHMIIFLSKLYVEVDVFDKRITSVGSLLHSVNCLFLELKDLLLVGNEISMIFPLSFEELSDTDYDITNNVKVIHSNLKKLDIYLSLVFNKYRNPIKITHHWMRYTFGAIGFSLLSVWLVTNRTNFVLRSKESITQFSTYDVDQPLTTTMRDKLLTTSPKEVMESKQVQSISDYLHRMFLDFSERTKNSLANAPFKGMVEMVTRSFEKRNKHLIEDLYLEDFARSMHIQNQRQNYDLGIDMTELERQIRRANEMISEFYARLKTTFFLFGVLLICHRVEKHTIEMTQVKRISLTDRMQTRLLIDQVEQRFVEVQNCKDLSPRNEEAHYKIGLALYSLDRLFRVVGRDAKSMGEWRGLKRDIFVLKNPRALSRLKEWYE